MIFGMACGFLLTSGAQEGGKATLLQNEQLLVVFAPMDRALRARALREARRLLKALQGSQIASIEIIDGPVVAQGETSSLEEAVRSLKAVEQRLNPERLSTDTSVPWHVVVEGSLQRIARREGHKAMVYIVQNDIGNASVRFARVATGSDIAIYPIFIASLDVAPAMGTAEMEVPVLAGGDGIQDVVGDGFEEASEYFRQRLVLDKVAKATGGKVLTEKAERIIHFERARRDR